MNQYGFYDDVIEAVKNLIPEELRDILSVEIKEVTKTNDTVLHGVVIQAPDQKIVPTIYIEDIVSELGKDGTMNDLAEGIIATYLHGMMETPQLEDLSFEFDDIKDKLQIQIAEASKNKDRLKDLVYKPLDNGMVMLAYVVIQESENDSYRFAMTKAVAEEHGYDMDKLFDAAMANSMEKNTPMMTDMMSMILSMDGREDANPLNENFRIAMGENMYVLTNSKGFMGASALYYPDVQKNIGDALMDNYYVLPSSQHEVIIIPEGAGIKLETLQEMVKDANRSVVDSRDVLSDRVFKFDREKQRLIEPKPLERSGSERGDR